MMVDDTQVRAFFARSVAGMLLGLTVCFALTMTSQAADPNGKALFERRCAGCHAIDTDHEGPRLNGVVGRRAGSVQMFQYSKALQDADFTWDDAILDKWLMDPDSIVPGNDMSFRVPKAEERAVIIAYLNTLTAR